MAGKYLDEYGAKFLIAKFKAQIASKANKATTLSGYGITDAYTKHQTDNTISALRSELFAEMAKHYTKNEVDSKLSSVYRYKGSVPTYSDLPVNGKAVGDVYNVETANPTYNVKAGDNLVWTELGWDNLGGTLSIDVSGFLEVEDTITNAEIEAMFA